MNRVTLFVTCLSLAGLLQGHVGFSGRWTLDSPAASADDAPRVLVVEQPITRTNIRGEPVPPGYLTITIRREGATGTTNETRLIGASGGTVGGVVGPVGQHKPAPSTRFENVWRDNALMFLNRVDGPDGPHTGEWSERRESWSLEPDGRLRIEIVTETYNLRQDSRVYLYHRD